MTTYKALFKRDFSEFAIRAEACTLAEIQDTRTELSKRGYYMTDCFKLTDGKEVRLW